MNWSNFTVVINESLITTPEQAYYVCLFQNSNQFIFFILLFAIYSYLIFEIVNSVFKKKLNYKIYTEFLFSFLVVLFFALQTSFFDSFCIINFCCILGLIVFNHFLSKKLNF
jgi:hypothetical protein